jgi:hypothetical protein
MPCVTGDYIVYVYVTFIQTYLLCYFIIIIFLFCFIMLLLFHHIGDVKDVNM